MRSSTVFPEVSDESLAGDGFIGLRIDPRRLLDQLWPGFSEYDPCRDRSAP